MPNSYVEDYEELTGNKPDDDSKPDVMTTAKVVTAPEAAAPVTSTVNVETK